jgi:cellobiose phosphorylase
VANSGREGSRASLEVDGVAIDGRTVPYAPAGSVVQVRATL